MAAITLNTTVRYEGSMEHLHGCYGWVTRVLPSGRFDVTLVTPEGSRRAYLTEVRPTSLVPGPNRG